jgi:hypothetical protein
VIDLRVGDVLGDRSPEVVLRARYGDGDSLFVCATDGTRRCAHDRIDAPRYRFVRPDVVVAGRSRWRVAL